MPIYMYVYSQPIVLSAELYLYYKYQQELCSYVCTCLNMSVHAHVLALTRMYIQVFLQAVYSSDYHNT